MKTEKIRKYKQTESFKMVQTNATDTNCKAMDANYVTLR